MSHAAGTSQTPATTPAGAGAERTIGQLVADASRDLSALVRAEIALAKSEITADVKQGALGAGLFAGAAAMAVGGALMLLFTVAYALSLVLPLWLSFLIVAVVLFVVAGVLGVVGLGRIKRVRKPERTVATSKASLEALKGHH